MSTLPSKPKSFWSKPDSVIGTGIFMAILGGIAYGAFKIMPYVLSFLQTTFYAGLYLAGGVIVFGGLLYVIFDPKTRGMFRHAYMSAIRWSLKEFITFDPIAIMKNYIEILIKKRENMNVHLTSVKGEISKLKGSINENNEKIDNNLRLAQSGVKQMETVSSDIEKLTIKGEVTVLTQEAGLLKDSNEKLQPLLMTLEKLYSMLQKLYINSEFLIRQFKNEVSAKEKMYKAFKEGTNAVRNASAIYGDGGVDKEMFDMSVEYLKDDMGNRIGEIDRFMENSMSIITNIDMQKGMNETKGLQMLEEFERSQFDEIFNKELGKVPNAPEKILIPKTNASGAYGKTESKFDSLWEENK